MLNLFLRTVVFITKQNAHKIKMDIKTTEHQKKVSSHHKLWTPNDVGDAFNETTYGLKC